jgi:MoaD family protein
MVVSVKVKLIGALRVSYGRDKVSLNIGHATVQAVIEKVSHSLSPDEERMLIDPELNDPRPNVLILVNGKEISALKGLGTEVRNGDEIVIIPVTHGG